MKAKEFCLDVLDMDQSLQLLSISSGMTFEDFEQTAKVIEECDRLPLALAMVGSMARAAHERGQTDPWKDILHRLLSVDLAKIKADFPDYPYPNLLRAIEVSVESLAPEEQSKYMSLGVFPEDTEVPEAVLQLFWDMDEYDTRDFAGRFSDRSLARFNCGNLVLHDLQHDFAFKRAGDLQALHGKLIEAYRKVCKDGWYTGPDDGYFFAHLADHLLKSGREQEMRSLVLDFRWIETRLEKTDTTSLIYDYNLMPKDQELKLCRDSLRLSSHVLFRDPSQLAGQLLGRMQHLGFTGIKGLMKQARAEKGRPWLRPMISSLTPPGGPLIRTLSGHSFWVNAVTLTPDGQRAVSASKDRTLKIWDMKSGRELQTLTGHSDWVRAVTLTPDGRQAVSASRDRTLKIWDMKSGRELQTLTGHSDGVNAVTLTPDGQCAISTSDDNTLKIWNMEKGRELQTLTGHSDRVNAVTLTPDGRQAISASRDRTLKIWDMKSGRELQTLIGHSDWVNAVTLTPDGQQVVSASDDNTLKIWDMESSRELQTLTGHSDRVNAVTLTPDGRQAISGSEDNTLKIWDLESGRELRTFTGDFGIVRVVVLTPDGRRVISASFSTNLKIWDMESGLMLRTLTGHSDGIRAVALTPDG
jgi:WD40 repeat protein